MIGGWERSCIPFMSFPPRVTFAEFWMIILHQIRFGYLFNIDVFLTLQYIHLPCSVLLLELEGVKKLYFMSIIFYSWSGGFRAYLFLTV